MMPAIDAQTVPGIFFIEALLMVEKSKYLSVVMLPYGMFFPTRQGVTSVTRQMILICILVLMIAGEGSVAEIGTPAMLCENMMQGRGQFFFLHLFKDLKYNILEPVRIPDRPRTSYFPAFLYFSVG